MLAGAYEALVGAVYLDQGAKSAYEFVLRFLERDVQAIRQGESDANPKGRLQEILQERAIPSPQYMTLEATGPDHAREFTEAVIVEGQQLGVGTGRSKRIAQQEAARQAIIALEAADS
jgi:ribonuclease-3